MAIDRRFSAELLVKLITQYKNISSLTNPKALIDNLDLDFSQGLTDGSGFERADLQFHDRRQLINATEVLALDGALTNKWGDSLDFDAIKILIVHNRETEISPLKLLEVHFKDERYYIGPNGTRIIIEPGPGGILPIVSSGSEIEGSITFSTNDDVTFDLIIIGSQNESSEA